MVDAEGRQVQIGVYGLAIASGQVLLARIAPDQVDSDLWTLPGGGLQWGDHPLEGLRREFWEETGLEARPLRPLGTHSFSISSEQRRHGEPPIHVLQAVWQFEANGTLVHEVGGSTVEARWWPLTDLGQAPVVELVTVALEMRAAFSPD